MTHFFHWLVWTIFGCLMFLESLGLAQGSGSAPTPESGSPPAARSEELPPPKLPAKQEFSRAEIQAECRKYEGQFIAYYDKIFKVEACKRRPIISDDDEQTPMLRHKSIVAVEGLTIAKIPEGEPIGQAKEKKLNCSKLEGRYILSRGDELYFIQSCKKHLIPDWDTYADHAQKRGKRGLEVFEVSETEFQALASGPDIKSVLDEEFKQLLDAEKTVDVIPLAEACKGLNGKFVSYYSRIYRIEACRKLPVDPEKFMVRNPRYKLQELSSEQWVSIPTGKAFPL